MQYSIYIKQFLNGIFANVSITINYFNQNACCKDINEGMPDKLD